jgi:hypothetical protein
MDAVVLSIVVFFAITHAAVAAATTAQQPANGRYGRWIGYSFLQMKVKEKS